MLWGLLDSIIGKTPKHRKWKRRRQRRRSMEKKVFLMKKC